MTTGERGVGCVAWISTSARHQERCSATAVLHSAYPFVDLCADHATEIEDQILGSALAAKDEAISKLIDQNLGLKVAVGDAISGLIDIAGPSRTTVPTDQNMTAKQQYVYFIQAQSFIKIGISVDPEFRLQSLKKSGNGTRAPRGIDLWNARLLHCFPGSATDEKELHAKFADLRVEGEWFAASQELTEYINMAANAA